MHLRLQIKAGLEYARLQQTMSCGRNLIYGGWLAVMHKAITSKAKGIGEWEDGGFDSRRCLIEPNRIFSEVDTTRHICYSDSISVQSLVLLLICSFLPRLRTFHFAPQVSPFVRRASYCVGCRGGSKNEARPKCSVGSCLDYIKP